MLYYTVGTTFLACSKRLQCITVKFWPVVELIVIPQGTIELVLRDAFMSVWYISLHWRGMLGIAAGHAMILRIVPSSAYAGRAIPIGRIRFKIFQTHGCYAVDVPGSKTAFRA